VLRWWSMRWLRAVEMSCVGELPGGQREESGEGEEQALEFRLGYASGGVGGIRTSSVLQALHGLVSGSLMPTLRWVTGLAMYLGGWQSWWCWPVGCRWGCCGK
jgi:hypothetical protein